MQHVRAVLVDSNRLFREGLKRILREQGFDIVAETATMQEAASILASGVVPDLVLFDLADGGEEEAEGMRKLRVLCGEARLVVLATDVCTRRIGAALDAGIDGYLLKDLSADALEQSLRLVLLGEKVFPAHLATLLVDGRADDRQVGLLASSRGLSQREVQILSCLLTGDSNKVIANRLKISEATVKVHLKGLLRKIGAVNRTQAAIWAQNNGLTSESAAGGLGT